MKKDSITGAWLSVPICVWLACIVLYPVLSTFYNSMTNQKLFGAPYDFVGLETYKWVFANSDFNLSLFTTAIWTVSSLILQIGLAVLTALLLNMDFKGRDFYRTWVILPWAIPFSVIAIIARWMLSSSFGVINYVLMDIRLISEPINFLGSMGLALGTVIIINVWKWFPFASIIFLAVLQGVSKEVIEAARIDGCNRFQQFLYIIMPVLKIPIATNALLMTFWNFNTFGLIWLLTAGGPANTTTTLPILVYRLAFKSFRLGAAAALSMIMFALLMIFTLLYRKYVKSNNVLGGA